MGKSWKNPHKVENANKKGAIISKMVKEIVVAVKLGGPDPGANARLRMAIDAAKEASCPKDTIERAIKKGSGQSDDKSQIEEVMYEGFGPHQVGVLVECQTDNRTRTAPDIRFLFKKYDGLMGEQGSVSWMFDRVSLVEGTHTRTDIDAEEEAIEVGANDVTKNKEGVFAFYGNPDDINELQKNLLARGWQIKTCEFSYRAKNKTSLSEEQLKEVYEFLDALDDNEDCARIHTTLE
jgi:YebC/PmpR family DNA-binding regulatory protein